MKTTVKKTSSRQKALKPRQNPKEKDYFVNSPFNRLPEVSDGWDLSPLGDYDFLTGEKKIPCITTVSTSLSKE